MLLADGVWRAQAHNCTKFRQNRSFRCGDIAIFWIFKMATAAILDFWNREILLVVRIQRVQMHLHAKFCQNLSINCEDIKIFRFFKILAAAILDFQNCEILLVDGVWRAQTHNCAKFRHNRRSIAEILLSLIHIWRCRRSTLCRSRWSPYH